MEVLLLAVMGVANILCFMIGAKIGQTVAKGEPVELPKFNPAEMIREHKSKKQAEHEQERLDVIMQNIENYDGTPIGQKDVPRG